MKMYGFMLQIVCLYRDRAQPVMAPEIPTEPRKQTNHHFSVFLWHVGSEFRGPSWYCILCVSMGGERHQGSTAHQSSL